MTVTIETIYRVVFVDQYQHSEPETYWTTDKESCEKYIADSYYKHCLRIESSTLTDKASKCK